MTNAAKCERRATTYSMAALLRLVTVVAVCFGVMHYLPGLGTAMLLVLGLTVFRIRMQQYTAWRVGWSFRVDRIAVAAIALPIYSLSVFSAIAATGVLASDARFETIGIVSLSVIGASVFAELITATVLCRKFP
jgi:hypothetical protein